MSGDGQKKVDAGQEAEKVLYRMRRASLFCKCVVLFGDGLFVGRSYWERAVYPWRRSAFFGGRPVLSWRRSDLFWRGSRHVGSRCEKRAGTFSTRGRIYLIRGEGPQEKTHSRHLWTDLLHSQADRLHQWTYPRKFPVRTVGRDSFGRGNGPICPYHTHGTTRHARL